MLGTNANQRDIRFFFVVVVPIAQLVRAPDCGSGGRGFEYRWAPLFMHFQQLLRLFVLPEPGFFSANRQPTRIDIPPRPFSVVQDYYRFPGEATRLAAFPDLFL